MFSQAAIPSGLIDSASETQSQSNASQQGWSFGPFQLPPPPGQQSHAPEASRSARPDLSRTVRQFAQLVSNGFTPSNLGRGGAMSTIGSSTQAATAGAAGRQGPSVSMRMEYAEETPRFVGKRSIALRPRHTLPLSGAEPVYDDRDARWFGDNDDVTHGSYSWAMQDYQADRRDVAAPGDAWRAEVPSEEELPPVTSCREFVKQVLVDNHGTGAVECSFPDAPCPAGSYKVLSFVAPLPADDPAANYLDFHFYVQHRDVVITLRPEDRLTDVARFFQVPVEELYDANPGLVGTPEDRPVGRARPLFLRNANVWSHKPTEWLPPRLHDGAGRAIHNPMRAVPAYSDDEGDKNELPSSFCCAFCVKPGQARTGPQPGRVFGMEGGEGAGPGEEVGGMGRQ